MNVEKERAVLVGVRFPAQSMWSVEDAMEELEQLALTAGAEVLYSVIQQRQRPHPAYFIGKGKAVEIGRLCSGKADLVIFNANLSAAQIRSLEEVIPAKVIDRTELILDIFAQRARSREGKLQVELAQLHYLLPKLVGQGISMSRLGGGIGSRGPGEMRLEVDRRRIRGRIRRLEEELLKVKSTRALHRRERQSVPFPTVALVGYTNSGKSTLLNRLTHAGVLAEEKLFATLDPTIRRLSLPHKREVLLVDTVGFIRDLPHMLIAAFMATLEETVQADLLLHVIDVSHPAMTSQIEAVLRVLKELNVLEKNRIEVYNKVDRIGGKKYGERLLRDTENSFKWNGKQVLISALSGEGVPELLEGIERLLFPGVVRISLFLPFDRGDLLARVYAEAKVLKRQETAHGVMCLIEIHPAALDGLKDFVFKGK
jgi:GTP-binding protein HflX